MAHGLFEHRVAERGWGDRYAVDSCGTAAYHAGESPDPRTTHVLAVHGVSFTHRARALRREDADRFDHILVADRQNLRDATRILGVAPELMLEPVGGGDVPDPYYGGTGGFETVFQLLDGAVNAWLDRWEPGR